MGKKLSAKVKRQRSNRRKWKAAGRKPQNMAQLLKYASEVAKGWVVSTTEKNGRTQLTIKQGDL